MNLESRHVLRIWQDRAPVPLGWVGHVTWNPPVREVLRAVRWRWRPATHRALPEHSAPASPACSCCCLWSQVREC